MQIAAVIPALNEQESIPQVIAELPTGLIQEVIVVDNGSTDHTAQIATAAGARVVHEPRRGYGYACAAGVAAAQASVDVLVFMDGDGSDDPSQMAALVAPIEHDRAELVLGSRTLGPEARDALLPHQRLGNRLTTALIQLLYHRQISDLPPFKAIRRSVLDGLHMREMTYGWTVEMIVKSVRLDHQIVEIPVTPRARIGGVSKVSGTLKGTVMAAYYMLGTSLKYAWRD